MSIIAKLYIDGKEINILSSYYSFKQHTDHTGRPTSKPNYVGLHVVVESRKDIDFTEWMISPDMAKQLEIRYISSHLGGKTRKIGFTDSHLVKHHTQFTAEGTNPMTETLFITSAGVKDSNTTTAYAAHWLKTIANNTPITVREEEEKDKKWETTFSCDNKDRKNGVYGWDMWEKSLERNCTSNKTKYHNAYNWIKVDGKEYPVPILSMRKDQSITLKLNHKSRQGKEYQSVAIAPHPDFDIHPMDLIDEPDEITIRCLSNAATTSQIKVTADGKSCGALDIWHPVAKTIKLRWVFVEIKGNQNDEVDLNKTITFSKLENYLKKALNPGLIDMQLVNAIVEIFDLTTLPKTNGMVQHFLQGIKQTFVPNSNSNVKSTNADRESFFNNLVNLYQNRRTMGKNPTDPEEVILFFSNLSCSQLNKNNLEEFTNGITKSGYSVMFMKNSQIKSNEEIPHEIMHAAGLPHIFTEKPDKDKEKEHIFKKGVTDNYMDYENEGRRKHTFHWQWKKLLNSKYSK